MFISTHPALYAATFFWPQPSPFTCYARTPTWCMYSVPCCIDPIRTQCEAASSTYQIHIHTHIHTSSAHLSTCAFAYLSVSSRVCQSSVAARRQTICNGHKVVHLPTTGLELAAVLSGGICCASRVATTLYLQFPLICCCLYYLVVAFFAICETEMQPATVVGCSLCAPVTDSWPSTPLPRH